MRVQVLTRARELIARKLGVCPFCMMTSAWGSVLSWCLVAVVFFFLHLDLVARLLVIPAAAFSLLFLAHLVAYSIRAGLQAMRQRRAIPRDWGVEIQDPSRREFLRVAVMAAGYALTISFLGDIPSFAQTTPCPGTQPPTPNFAQGFGATQALSEADYNKDALKVCDRFCETRGCTPAEGACLQNDDPKKKPVTSRPKCVQAGAGSIRCEGKVKQCTCRCEKCAGEHRPPDTSHGLTGEYDPAVGVGMGATGMAADTAARDDARTKCDRLCERFKNCVSPQVCKRDGEPQLVESPAFQSNPGWTKLLRILKCKCKCE